MRACGRSVGPELTCPRLPGMYPRYGILGRGLPQGNMIDFDHMHRGAKNNRSLVFSTLVSGICVLATTLAVSASAYLFGPGKYCGVVVFDRWGTCYLVSGPYVNYVASNVKSELLPYKGKAIQVDASEVGPGGFWLSQPDPMIHKYKILGPAPEPKWITIDGLQLIAVTAFGRYTRPQFLIEIRNVGNSPVKVDRSKIGILLFKAEKSEVHFSDDDSWAYVSRTGIEDASYIGTAQTGEHKTSWGYIVDMTTRPAATFVIQPGQAVRTRIRFKIYAGQYQFMFAYGDGVSSEKTLVSNATSFDIGADGRAIRVKE